MQIKISRKKLLSIVSMVVLSLVVVYGGKLLYESFAYFQDKDFETNYHSVGSNESNITKSFTKPSKLESGTRISYSCKVTNNGSVPCYVRVLLVPASNPGSFVFNTESCDSNMSSSSKWYHDAGVDNYYYYKTPLKPGESTPNLLNSVTLNKDISGEISDYCQIFSYEETHQSEGYSDCLSAFQ